MSIWLWAVVGLFVGFLPGVLLFPWVASPFGPGLWMLDEPFARIHFTISQVIRRRGVLVKRESGEYEHATYLPDDEVALCSDGTRVPIDSDRTSWGLFGKRPLGITWELGTDLHQRVRRSTSRTGSGEEVADGDGGYPIDMGAVHRYFRGVNDSDLITRTKEKAEAEHGGGDQGMQGWVMAVLVGLMLVLGSLTGMLVI